jgi:hypothetical protein
VNVGFVGERASMLAEYDGAKRSELGERELVDLRRIDASMREVEPLPRGERLRRATDAVSENDEAIRRTAIERPTTVMQAPAKE